MDEKKLEPKVVLGIAAHPDDLDFSSSGTMAYFASLGAEVHYLILTDGGNGTDDSEVKSSELTKIRYQEQRDALDTFGGKSVTFLSYPDGKLANNDELKKDIIKVIRTIKPDTVLTTDPSVLYSATRGMINHPDHRAAGQATLDSVYPFARDHLAYPELYEQGFLPHKTKNILLVNFENQNFFVDISKTIDLKLKASACHKSQIKSIEQISEFIQNNAKAIGAKSGYQFAEGFIRITINT